MSSTYLYGQTLVDVGWFSWISRCDKWLLSWTIRLVQPETRPVTLPAGGLDQTVGHLPEVEHVAIYSTTRSFDVNCQIPATSQIAGEVMGSYSLLKRVAIVASVAAALSGCSATGATAASPAVTAPVASGAFAYACAAGGDCGAFMTIANQGAPADKLVSVTTTVTSRAELHTMVMDAQGNMMMQKVDGIAVPANGTLELKPGSFHVMLFGLNKELKVGDSFPLTLKFEQGGVQTLQVQVKEKN